MKQTLTHSLVAVGFFIAGVLATLLFRGLVGTAKSAFLDRLHSHRQVQKLDASPTAATLEQLPTSSASKDSKSVQTTSAASDDVSALEEQQLRNKLFNYTMTKVNQRKVQDRYNVLFDELRLDPATSSTLKALLVERTMAIDDAAAAAAKTGAVVGSNAYLQGMAMATADSNDKIKALIGEDGYQKFLKADSLAGSEYLIANFIGKDMAFSGAPLTETQSSALAAVMRDLHYSVDDPQFQKLVNQPVDPATGLSPLNAALVQKTEAFLNPSQTEVLRAYQKEQSAYQKMYEMNQPAH